MTLELKTGFANNQSVSIPTLVGLANGSTAVSAIIFNATDLFINAEIQLKFKTTSPVSSTGTITLMLLKSLDGISFDDPTDSHEVLGVFIARSDNTTYVVSATTSDYDSLPAFWRLAVKNDSGAALDSTASNFSLKFNGKYVYTTI